MHHLTNRIMSLFDKDIATSEIPCIKEGRKWMTDTIIEVVNYFMRYNKRLYKDEWEVMEKIRQEVIMEWIGNPVLKKFHINGTGTGIFKSEIKGYKYVIVVEVRFDWCDTEDYVEYVRVPVIKL